MNKKEYKIIKERMDRYNLLVMLLEERGNVEDLSKIMHYRSTLLEYNCLLYALGYHYNTATSTLNKLEKSER